MGDPDDQVIRMKEKIRDIRTKCQEQNPISDEIGDMSLKKSSRVSPAWTF
jgi:hypothetical protein